MMMAMNYFSVLPELNKSVEGKLRRKLRLRRIDAVPVSTLASHMLASGLSVEVVTESPDKFWRFLRETNLDNYEQQQKAYVHAKHVGVDFSFDAITPDRIIQMLDNSNLVICGIDLGFGVKHAILLYGYKDGEFLAIDPMSGETVYTPEKLMQESDLDTGRWIVSVSGVKRTSYKTN